MVQLYWLVGNEPEANYVQAIVGSQRVDIIRLDTQFGGRLTHSTVEYVILPGGVIEFDLPRSLFRRAETVTWLAYGVDAACGTGTTCQDAVPNDDDAGPPAADKRPTLRMP